MAKSDHDYTITVHAESSDGDTLEFDLEHGSAIGAPDDIEGLLLANSLVGYFTALGEGCRSIRVEAGTYGRAEPVVYAETWTPSGGGRGTPESYWSPSAELPLEEVPA